MVFFIASGFYFIGNLLFIIFGKTDEQFWNNLSAHQTNGVATTNAIKTDSINNNDVDTSPALLPIIQVGQQKSSESNCAGSC